MEQGRLASDSCYWQYELKGLSSSCRASCIVSETDSVFIQLALLASQLTREWLALCERPLMQVLYCNFCRSSIYLKFVYLKSLWYHQNWITGVLVCSQNLKLRTILPKFKIKAWLMKMTTLQLYITSLAKNLTTVL